VGAQGPIGLTGSQGPIGLTGPQGPIGLTGPAGSDTLQPEVTRVPGRIGINDASPDEALSVSGNVSATGNIGAAGAVFYGNGATRTETRNDAGAAGGRSGFFETQEPINFYPGAASWQHLFEVRHSNSDANYALQLGGSFFDQDLWFRKTNNSGATGWSQLTGAGERDCTAPFNAIAVTSTTSFTFPLRRNTICGSNFFAAQNFQTAQELCFAMGGHIPTYSEMFILAKAHTLPNGNVMLNGDWIGNRVGDDDVLAVDDQTSLNDFEMQVDKNFPREFRCVQTSTIVQ
jgi:hypothetical protein